jgi:hypothetical protein
MINQLALEYAQALIQYHKDPSTYPALLFAQNLLNAACSAAAQEEAAK